MTISGSRIWGGQSHLSLHLPLLFLYLWRTYTTLTKAKHYERKDERKEGRREGGGKRLRICKVLFYHFSCYLIFTTTTAPPPKKRIGGKRRKKRKKEKIIIYFVLITNHVCEFLGTSAYIWYIRILLSDFAWYLSLEYLKENSIYVETQLCYWLKEVCVP